MGGEAVVDWVFGSSGFVRTRNTGADYDDRGVGVGFVTDGDLGPGFRVGHVCGVVVTRESRKYVHELIGGNVL
jgi:hypothetical protein